MLSLFNVHTIMITLWGYPLSYIEAAGTLFYLVSVWLISKKNILTWPTGIISVILYGILFYQIRLYADMLEQVYYFVISIAGWLLWNKKQKTDARLPTTWSSARIAAGSLVVTACATALLTYCIAHFHLWLPHIFPQAASLPFLDALTTVMSFTAMYLTTIRKNESWLYWIMVDGIGVGLYWHKNVKFIAIQYIILLCMAVYGLINWASRRHRK